MTRSLLSVFSAIVLCASTFSVMAADSTSTQASTSQQRAQIDAKREQITGADKVELPAAKTSSTLLDSPVQIDDAPDQAETQNQEQQP